MGGPSILRALSRRERHVGNATFLPSGVLPVDGKPLRCQRVADEVRLLLRSLAIIESPGSPMLFMSSLCALTLGKLVADYDTEIRRVLTRRLGCVETAADILQETYRRLANGELWRQADNPRALMYRIALNLATDHERRLKTESRYLAPDEDLENITCSSPSPERVIEARERLERLLFAVQNLPPRCREVFILRKFEDLSQVEIAERLELSRSSVEKHLRHALNILRDSLD